MADIKSAKKIKIWKICSFILTAFLLAGCTAFRCSCGEREFTEYTDVKFLGDNVHYAAVRHYSRSSVGAGIWASTTGKLLEENWTVELRNVATGEKKDVFSATQLIETPIIANLSDTSVTFFERNGKGHVYKYTGKEILNFNFQKGAEGWLNSYDELVVNKADGIYSVNPETYAEKLIRQNAYVDAAQNWGLLIRQILSPQVFLKKDSSAIAYDFRFFPQFWLNENEICGMATALSDDYDAILRYSFTTNKTDTLLDKDLTNVGTFSVSSDCRTVIYLKRGEIITFRRN